MSLPVGFDPVHMTMSSGPRVDVPRSHNTSSTTRSTYRSSWWSSINDAIGSFGNWIDSHISNVVNGVTFVLLIFLYIAAIAWVFMAESFLWGVARAIGAVFIVGIGYYAVTIGSWAVAIVLKIIRFCFWNAWTLLITILLIVGFLCFADINFTSNEVELVEEVVEEPVIETTTYTCTAKVLNVRSAPNKSARVLGAIRKGTHVEVYDTTNGFARIDYNGQTGYVSTSYLRLGY